MALTIAVSLGVAASVAAAEPVALDFSEFYPVTRTEDGHAAGPGIELARRLAEDLPITLGEQAVPLRRLLMLTQQRPILVAALIRTPEREGRFQWIGELYRDSLVMVTKKPHRRIDDLDQARSAGRIGVTLGGIAEALLEQRHFTNIEPSQDMTAQARKLAGGRVDVWCALKQSARAAWEATGQDPAEAQVGAEIEPVSIWIAASASVPAETVETLRRRFADLQRDGSLDRIFKGLR